METEINLHLFRTRTRPHGEVLAEMDKWIKSYTPVKQSRMVAFCEASLLHSASKNSRVREALGTSYWVFADGIATRMVAQLCGTPFPERMQGPVFILRACEYGQKHGWRHFFYGGVEGVADQLASRLLERFPQLVVAGTFCPPFRELSKSEEEAVQQQIEGAKTDILWVALGSPRQELWVASHLSTLRVPFILPVGAAFDFHSGNRPWAPSFVRKLGMEWLWRMGTGGGRIFRRNVACVSNVAWLILRLALRRMVKG